MLSSLPINAQNEFESSIQRTASASQNIQEINLGSERYLVDEALLVEFTRKIQGQLLDPIKTTVVQDQRAMTTWVVRKL